MAINQYKVVEGAELQPSHIRIPRAAAIFRVAKTHPYVSDVYCKITPKGDTLIFMTVDSEIADIVKNDIHEKEPIAIKCYKSDNQMPEVYALRKDFPLGLPHSNAVPFDHPVSLCVSDVPFQDYRTNFSAFNFIELIRRWFSKNAIGELHEKNRPLEVFFDSEEITYFPFIPQINSNYYFIRYTQKTNLSSVVEEVSEGNANYCLLLVPVSVNVAGYVHRVPKKLGEFRNMQVASGIPFKEAIVNAITNSPRMRRCYLPLMLGLIMPMSRQAGQQYEDINLFSLRLSTTGSDVFSKYNKLSKPSFDKFLDDIDVHISFLVNGVSVDRLRACGDCDSLINEVAFLGTGALGSQILDHFVRRGQAKVLHLVDSDIMFPHNEGRHTLDVSDVMNYKVKALKDKYQGIEGLKLYTYPEDFLSCSEKTTRRVLTEALLVIDASTSVGVERHLALDLDKYSTRRCTTFLNPKGTDVVMLMEDKERHHRLDLLEMDYYRAVIKETYLDNHLAVSEKQRTNIFSCRAESVVMDFNNVAVLASIVSSQIPRCSVQAEAQLTVWQMDAAQGTVARHDLCQSNWQSYKTDTITVMVSDAVTNEMIHQREQKLQNNPPVETGGTLLGTYDKDRNLIYMIYMIPAPDDSVEAGTSYIRGVEGLFEEVERIKRRTGHQIVYLGEWHSHPHHCSNAPSAYDQTLFDTMSTEMSNSDYPFVMGILGDEGLNLKVQM